MELHLLSTEKKKAVNPDFYILPPPQKKTFKNERDIGIISSNKQ